MEFLKKINLNNVFMESLYIIVGIVLIIWSDIAVQNICYIAAVVVAAIGICYVVDYFRLDLEESFKKKNLAYGISYIIGGIVIFLRESDISSFIPVILGFIIIISGIIKFQDSIDLARMKFENWYVVLIISIINIVFGIILTLNPFEWNLSLLNMWLGIGLVFSGVTDITTSIVLSRFFTKHRDDIAYIEENKEKIKAEKKAAKKAAKEAAKAAKKQQKADEKAAAKEAKKQQKADEKAAKEETKKTEEINTRVEQTDADAEILDADTENSADEVMVLDSADVEVVDAEEKEE